MTVAKVFKSGNSQAVRLPKQFRFKSAEVEIFRRGDEVVLREVGAGKKFSELLAALPVPDFPDHIEDLPEDDVEPLS